MKRSDWSRAEETLRIQEYLIFTKHCVVEKAIIRINFIALLRVCSASLLPFTPYSRWYPQSEGFRLTLIFTSVKVRSPWQIIDMKHQICQMEYVKIISLMTFRFQQSVSKTEKYKEKSDTMSTLLLQKFWILWKILSWNFG